MDGYRFLRFEASPEYQLRAQGYAEKAAELAGRLTEGAEDIRSTSGYKDSKEWLMMATEGAEEHLKAEWMRYYMVNAIAYGLQTKGLDWREKFLAAHDLYTGV